MVESIGLDKIKDEVRIYLQHFTEEFEVLKVCDGFPKKRYTLGKQIAQGSFGIVTEGRDKETGLAVAIKKIFIDHRFKNRELEILMQVNDHPFILKLDNYFYSNTNKDVD
jgi:serine/threonine protein kinase